MQENNKNTNWIIASVVILVLALGFLSYYNRDTLKKFFGFATVWNAFSYDTAGNLAVTNDWTTDSGSYAWNESSGWIDFSPTNGNVYVADNALWGYVYGENIGWVSLNCGNTDTCSDVSYEVQNDGNGNLSGQAWGENVGWIDFGHVGGPYEVKIASSTGDFSGYAWGENIGWISFNSSNPHQSGSISYKVSTNWQPSSVRNPLDVKKPVNRKLTPEEQVASSTDLSAQDQNASTTGKNASSTSVSTSTERVLTPINTIT